MLGDDKDKIYRKLIREAYVRFNSAIKNGVRLSPYGLGIDWIFSPIEDNVWGNIRFIGLPLYPEYPVGPYFIDFADPFRKIGIEVDSRQWHRDKGKDREKDKYLKSLGWSVHRIPSYMTYKTKEDFTDDEGKIDFDSYVTNSSEGYLWDLYKDTDYKNRIYMEIL